MAALKTLVLTTFFIFSLSVIGEEISRSYSDGYEHGHGALDVFDGAGFLATPTWVQVWVGCLISTFIIGFYFTWNHPIARWTTGGLIASLMSGHTIFSLLGLPFLGGSIAIMHLVFWTPAFIFLLVKRPFFESNEAIGFRIWSGVMTVAISFSFFFDIKDAAIYINHVSG